MATTTTNLSLTKPAVNDPTDEDLWGGQLNTNMDTLDSEAATKTVDLNFADKLLSRPDMKDVAETTKSLGSISGAVTIDYEDGNYQFGTVSGDISSVTISNLPASGKVGFITVEYTQDGGGANSITHSSTFRFPGGFAPDLSQAGGAIDKFRYETRDAGTNIDVFVNTNIS